MGNKNFYKIKFDNNKVQATEIKEISDTEYFLNRFDEPKEDDFMFSYSFNITYYSKTNGDVCYIRTDYDLEMLEALVSLIKDSKSGTSKQ